MIMLLLLPVPQWGILGLWSIVSPALYPKIVYGTVCHQSCNVATSSDITLGRQLMIVVCNLPRVVTSKNSTACGMDSQPCMQSEPLFILNGTYFVSVTWVGDIGPDLDHKTELITFLSVLWVQPECAEDSCWPDTYYSSRFCHFHYILSQNRFLF